jgi:hypothetical protein
MTIFEPATGERARLLQQMSSAAYLLTRVVEKELSGVRDGDGRWHGSDPLAYATDIAKLYHQLNQVERYELDANAAAERPDIYGWPPFPR